MKQVDTDIWRDRKVDWMNSVMKHTLPTLRLDVVENVREKINLSNVKVVVIWELRDDQAGI